MSAFLLILSISSFCRQQPLNKLFRQCALTKSACFFLHWQDQIIISAWQHYGKIPDRETKPFSFPFALSVMKVSKYSATLEEIYYVTPSYAFWSPTQQTQNNTGTPPFFFYSLTFPSLSSGKISHDKTRQSGSSERQREAFHFSLGFFP